MPRSFSGALSRPVVSWCVRRAMTATATHNAATVGEPRPSLDDHHTDDHGESPWPTLE